MEPSGAGARGNPRPPGGAPRCERTSQGSLDGLRARILQPGRAESAGEGGTLKQGWGVGRWDHVGVD